MTVPHKMGTACGFCTGLGDTQEVLVGAAGREPEAPLSSRQRAAAQTLFAPQPGAKAAQPMCTAKGCRIRTWRFQPPLLIDLLASGLAEQDGDDPTLDLADGRGGPGQRQRVCKIYQCWLGGHSGKQANRPHGCR